MAKRNHLLLLLLTIHIIKGIVTDILVPLWEFPDEQAHFAQVSYQVETGFPIDPYLNLSQEIYESERILGTFRNPRGDNAFTYHPLHQHQFSDSFTGPSANYLNSLPALIRATYVSSEAARGEPLYYHLSSTGYLAGYHQDLITRVNLSRFISILLSTLTVYLAFQIGIALLPGQHLFAFSLATLTSFQPMFSFVSSGVNNDNLINLIGALLLYISCQIITSGLTLPLGLAAGATIGLGILTKPLIYPLIPGVGLALLFDWYRTKRNLTSEFKLLLPLAVIAIAAGGWKFLQPLIRDGYIVNLPHRGPNSPVDPISLINYIKISLSLHYRQTLVWYWGVFKWLGVILPLPVIRIVKLIILASGVGLIKAFVTKPKLLSRYQLVFLALYSLSFLIILSLWDWLLMRSIGFSQGIQGRYFFTTIIAHLALIVVGLVNLFPKHLTSVILKLTAVLMVILHFISLKVLASAYYSLSHWATFWHQLSQYKPVIYKYPLNLLWFLVYFGLLVIFLGAFVTYSQRKVKS